MQTISRYDYPRNRTGYSYDSGPLAWRKPSWDCRNRAEYHLWTAIRRFHQAGARRLTDLEAQAETQAEKAKARFYLDLARRLRLEGR